MNLCVLSTIVCIWFKLVLFYTFKISSLSTLYFRLCNKRDIETEKLKKLTSGKSIRILKSVQSIWSLNCPTLAYIKTYMTFSISSNSETEKNQQRKQNLRKQIWTFKEIKFWLPQFIWKVHPFLLLSYTIEIHNQIYITYDKNNNSAEPYQVYIILQP